MGEVVRLPRAFDRTDMTPEQALSASQRYDWERVMIVGFVKEHDELTLCTSHMSREQALWITEHLKKHILGDLA